NDPCESEPFECNPAEQLDIRIHSREGNKHADADFVRAVIHPSSAKRNPGRDHQWRDDQEHDEKLNEASSPKKFFQLATGPIQKQNVEDKKEISRLQKRARQW